MPRSRAACRLVAWAAAAAVTLVPAGGAPAAPAPTTPGPAGPAVPPVDAGVLEEEAARQIREGDIAGARARYRRVLDAAPGDVEALFGYARTSAWLADYAAAERAYRDGLARAPRSLEGLLGLADVLAWTGRYDEALDQVAAAEALDPRHPEVWRRRGRFNRWRGEQPAARAAYARMLELAPGDPEATRALEEFASETRSTLELSYSREWLSRAKADRFGTDADDLGSVQYTYTGVPRLTLLGRVTYSDRFGDREVDTDDFQLVGGAAWRFLRRTTLRVEGALAPDADTLPAAAAEVELLEGLSLGSMGSLVVGAGYRYLDFNRVVRQDAFGSFQVDPATTVHILSPSVEWTTPWSLVLLVRYYYSLTDSETIPPLPGFPGLAGGEDNTSSILVKATFFPEARLSPFVAYARGVESFATAAQLRGLTTDTYAAGATLTLTRRFGLRATFEYQDSGRDTASGTITQSNLIVGTFVRW